MYTCFVICDYKMFGIPLLILSFCFVQFSLCFTNGLIGFLYGFPRVCFCRCGVSQKNILDSIRSGRLLVGESASPHEFPWLAVVNAGSKTFTGTLISDRHVLTSASPLYGVPANTITVHLGAHDRCNTVSDSSLQNGVMQVLTHPGYSSTSLASDIALLKLKHMVQFSSFVSPICIPRYWSDESHQVAWIAAWNNEENNNTAICTPRVATLPILPSESCFKTSQDSTYVTQEKGCLGPVGVKSVLCKIDVGAPVMTRRSTNVYRLVGLMSSATTCDLAGSLFTKIEDHASWIHENIRYDCQCV